LLSLSLPSSLRGAAQKTTTLPDLMATFTDGKFLDRRLLVSGGAFSPGNAYFVTELMGQDVQIDFNSSTSRLTLSHRNESNPDGSLVEIAMGTIDYARVVQADPASYLSPWLQLEGPGQTGWLYVVFPLWYNYTISPPALVTANVQFFWNWVNQNGWSFQFNNVLHRRRLNGHKSYSRSSLILIVTVSLVVVVLFVGITAYVRRHYYVVLYRKLVQFSHPGRTELNDTEVLEMESDIPRS